MIKTMVVYSTISGFTKKYAEWIAEELGVQTHALRDFDVKNAQSCDTIIYGGNLHAVGINGLKKFKRLTRTLDNKTFVVFACGASPARSETLEHVVRHNFTEQECARFTFFYMRGGFDFGKLDFFNKILMTLMKWNLAKKKNRTEDEEGMLAAISKPIDFSGKENIGALIDFCRSKGGPR